MPVGLVVAFRLAPAAQMWLYHKYRMWWLGCGALQVRTGDWRAGSFLWRQRDRRRADSPDDAVFSTARISARPCRCLFRCGRLKVDGDIIDNAEVLREAARSAGIRPGWPCHTPNAPEQKVVQSRSLSHQSKNTSWFSSAAEYFMSSGRLTLDLHDYALFPYELDLAKREVASLVGGRYGVRHRRFTISGGWTR